MAEYITDLRSALDINGWRTQEALNQMSLEDKRNTLIGELNIHSTMSIPQLQGKHSDSGFNSLVGMAAIYYFLSSNKLRNTPQLQQMSDGDQRNTLIVELNKITDETIKNLHGKDDRALVQLGAAFYAKDREITKVVDLRWILSGAKIIEQIPEILFSKDVRNPSNQEYRTSFSYTKTIQKDTSFEHSTSMNVGMTNTIEFKAGIPEIAEVSGSISFHIGTTTDWTYRKATKVSNTFTNTIAVTLQPGASIRQKAILTIANIDVPCEMDIETANKTPKTIRGVWHGVSMFNLRETQENIIFPDVS